MKRRALIALWVGLYGSLASIAAADMSKGLEQFEERHWTNAIGEFLSVIRQDPQNSRAHEYLTLAAQQMETQKRTATYAYRQQLLQDASRRLENNRLDPTLLEDAIKNSAQAEQKNREERWHAQCAMAAMEYRRGHSAAANDLVLRVIKEDANNIEAQKLLSDLQSQIRQTLDSDENLPVPERATLEGFYAYGQADYRTALAAWTKARSFIETFPPEEADRQLAALHFESYEKTAKEHVEEEDRTLQARALFTKGVELYQKDSYAQAQNLFRQVALINPEYPQLGMHLVQSESRAEKVRTRLLSQKNKDIASLAFAQGLAALEATQYSQAKKAFEGVLKQDPSHPQARSYLAVVDTEMIRRHDPQAAETHYEAGLINYASGKLEEAVREWNIATRLDPNNKKAVNALSKVQKEMSVYRGVPG